MSFQPPEDQYINIGSIRTRYWTLGDSGSFVILIHGFGGYIENWIDNITALARDHRVYALDIVGFGRTDKPRIKNPIPYVTNFLHDFMAAQGIERAALIGESMGGGLALWLTLQYPQLVEKLVLADSAGFGKEVSMALRLMSVPILGEYLSRPSREGIANTWSHLIYDQDLIKDQWLEEAYEMASLPGAQTCQLSVLRSMCNLWGGKRSIYQPILERMGEIEIPTLVIWGAQDEVLPIAHAHRAMAGLPNAQLHIFDPCGHVPNLEHAHEFNTLVSDFLSRT